MVNLIASALSAISLALAAAAAASNSYANFLA
jgi:hypothetical protein